MKKKKTNIHRCFLLFSKVDTWLVRPWDKMIQISNEENIPQDIQNLKISHFLCHVQLFSFMASLYSSSLCLSSLWLSYNHCCDAWTSIIISGLTSSTQYRTKQVDSITSYCGVVHAAVICLGIIRRHLNFQCLSPGGQPHWPASTDWFIAWARRQAVASLHRWTKLETAFSRTSSCLVEHTSEIFHSENFFHWGKTSRETFGFSGIA